MALEIFEAARSRPLMVGVGQGSIDCAFLIRGSEDEALVWSFLHANTPAVYLGLWKQSVSVDPQGGGFWNGTVKYGLPTGKDFSTGEGGGSGGNTPAEYADSDILGPEFSWDTTGGTQHITQSRRTLSRTARPGSPAVPDFKGAIGVSEDGVAGCDVLVPKGEFSITLRVERVSHRYWKRLEDITGCMNLKRWNTHRPGEVRFDGSAGKYAGNNRDDFSFMVTYKFSRAKNQEEITLIPAELDAEKKPKAGTDFTIKGGPSPDGKSFLPAKRGWDHIWCGYRKEADADQVVQRPVFAVVEEVLEAVDFREELGF